MKKRIKYSVLEENVISEPIFCVDGNYHALIIKKNLEVWILKNSIIPIRKFNCKTIHEAKKKSKETFKELGAIFYVEKRKKVII